ncbi:unnamed protein product [Blepharisma stoltei]|uniref:Receptor ligand binding region domain-containing protein n=1 Tax=Blepharisma stoltei TaxID=1481888 RepID=A0AAU9JH33_9CILI|nr:unnamed protein product [Blepharisma stoltei]
MFQLAIKLIFYLFVNLALTQYLNVPILYSQFTPTAIKDVVLNQYNCPNLSSLPCKSNPNAFYIPMEINDVNDFEELIAGSDITYLFDLTFSTIMSSHISAYAKPYNFMHLVYGFIPDNRPQLTYFSDTSEIIIRNAAVSFVKHYGWQKAVVFLSQELNGMDFKDVNDIEVVYQAILPSRISYEAISIIVSKEVKPLGVKTIIIATNEKISKLIQKAIEAADMNKEGYVFIFLHQSAWTAYLEGAILIEQYDWTPTGVENYIEILINNTTIFLLMFMNMDIIQGAFSLYAFYAFLINGVNIERFYLFNIQNSELVPFGNITSSVVNLYSSPMFPGGTNNIPDNSRLKIPISIAGGISNPDGSTYDFNANCHKGSVYAANSINTNSKILENFQLVINNITDCGTSYFDSDYATSCFSKHLEDLGYFHVSPQQVAMIEGTMTVFQSLNISIPVLGTQSCPKLKDDDNLQYTSVSFSNTYTASAVVLLLTWFRIAKCSLLYLDTNWGLSFKNQFVSQAEKYNLEILNKNQAVPSGYNGTDKSFIQEIVDLKSRYVIIEVSNTEIFSVLNAFYDLGMRKGDLYFIFGEGSFRASEANILHQDSYKSITELVEGSLYVTFLSYYGVFGKQIYNDFLQEFGFTYDYMCLFYDATYLGAYAIDSMISRGFNLNSSGIEEWVRKVQFTGCSGNVQISKSGNDRSTVKVGTYNLIKNNSEWQLVLTGIYDPTKVVVFEMIEGISWYSDNKGILPSEIIGADLSCPFKSDEVRSFLYGYLILLIIGGIFLIFDLFFIYKSFEYSPIGQFPMIIEKAEENIFDQIMYLAMLIECLQYVSIGPKFTDIMPNILTKVIKIAIIDIRDFTNDSKFLYQLSMIGIIVILFFTFLFGRIFDCWKRCKLSLLTIIGELGNYSLPIIGDVLFLPIFYFLFLTFQCTESIEDSFKKSFLNQDCSIFCWQGKHLKYAVASLVALLFYLPTSLHFRPSWKENTGDLIFHFKEQPAHSAIKSFLQIILAILNAVLLPYSEIAYDTCYTIILIIFGIFTLFRKPYNYERASLWYTTFIFGCVWLWICCEIARFSAIAGKSLIGIGWLLLGIIGMIYQYRNLPSLLESPKGQDILSLFKFQLSKRSPSQAGVLRSVNYEFADQSYDDKKSEFLSEDFN